MVWILAVKIDENGTKLGTKPTAVQMMMSFSHWRKHMRFRGSSQSDISGDKSENSRGERDFWLVKIDKNGTKIWDKPTGRRRRLLNSFTVSRKQPTAVSSAGFSDSDSDLGNGSLTFLNMITAG